MAGRPKIFDEKEAIDKAIGIFWEKGYVQASADELLEAMGIGKSSFYHSFKGGKRELFEKAMQQRSDEGMQRFKNMLAESGSVLDYLKQLFMNVLDVKSKRSKNGCLLGNAIAELSNAEPELKEIAASLLLRLEKIFLTIVKQAQANGEIKKSLDPDLLAKQLLTLWNGLNISVRMYKSPKALQPVVDAFFKTL